MGTVAEGVNSYKKDSNGIILITHYQRLLDYIKPDYVHVMSKGRIVRSGGPELAKELELGARVGSSSWSGTRACTQVCTQVYTHKSFGENAQAARCSLVNHCSHHYSHHHSHEDTERSQNSRLGRGQSFRGRAKHFSIYQNRRFTQINHSKK